MNNRTGSSGKTKVSRRKLLKLTLGTSVGGGVAMLFAGVASADEGICADLDDIFSLYGSLNYSEESPVEGKNCGICSFFDHDGQGDCRYCEVMGAQVNINGYCDSWNTMEE